MARTGTRIRTRTLLVGDGSGDRRNSSLVDHLVCGWSERLAHRVIWRRVASICEGRLFGVLGAWALIHGTTRSYLIRRCIPCRPIEIVQRTWRLWRFKVQRIGSSLLWSTIWSISRSRNANIYIILLLLSLQFGLLNSAESFIDNRICSGGILLVCLL